MNRLIERNREGLEGLCRRYRVRSLELFGSATTDSFDERESDLDFLVEFDAAADLSRADQYFGLLESLERLFDRPVDLVTLKSLRNPYFIRAVNETRRSLYVA